MKKEKIEQKIIEEFSDQRIMAMKGHNDIFREKILSFLKKYREELLKEILPKEMDWIGGKAELHIQIADGWNACRKQIKENINKLKGR